MPVRAIVGAQWGDEGKGKITDLLAQDAYIVIRYGGGSNAGHTVVNSQGEFRLHAIPSGIFNSQAVSLIGTGAVIDFDALGVELDDLVSQGIGTDGLRISSRAHVVMPYHLLLDRLGDEARGTMTIGTTRRGVGPTYVDKADRVGIQTVDILYPAALRQKLELVLPQKNRILQDYYGHPPFDMETLLTSAHGWRERFGKSIVDQIELVSDALDGNKRILLEGQLGALRDLDWGTYPYVTSSTTIAGGGAVGGGIPAQCIDSVIGVVKAYTSAVGAGPLPSELIGQVGDDLRERGNEYGATTGRPRRVGWFDAVATRYACKLNRFTGLAITKLDVLDGIPNIPVCTAYRAGSESYATVPATPVLQTVEPQYEELAGWTESTRHAKQWEDLPENARAYVRRIEELVGAPVKIVSVGQSREQTIIFSAID
ncbi:MAG: adenylosuccinate synthase [Chloroflexota bacterium]